MTAYPEHEKIEKVQLESNTIGEFLDWLPSKDIQLGTWTESGEFIPLHRNIEKLLAEFFEIDLEKIEQEKRAMLELLRNNKPKIVEERAS